MSQYEPNRQAITQYFHGSVNLFYIAMFGQVFSFFLFFSYPTAYTPERIFTQNMPEDVITGQEVPFGSLDNYISYLDL